MCCTSTRQSRHVSGLTTVEAAPPCHRTQRVNHLFPSVDTLISICFGLASSRLGIRIVNSPLSKPARMLSTFTMLGSEKLRVNVPKARSTLR